jgi:hypothetical protein
MEAAVNNKVLKLRLVAIFLSVAASAMAGGSGSAVLPWWLKAGGTWTTDLYVTNISNSTINVRITLYDSIGNIYDETVESGTNFYFGAGFGANPVGNWVAVAPHQTGGLNITSAGSMINGYGLVEWTSSNNEIAPAMATALYRTWTGSSCTGISNILLNEGKPF